MKIITILVLVLIATSVIVVASGIKIKDVKDLTFDKVKTVSSEKMCETMEKNDKIKIKCKKVEELESDMIMYNEENGIIRISKLSEGIK